MEEMVPNSGSVELVTASCAWSPTAIRPICASSTVTSTFQESVPTITKAAAARSAARRAARCSTTRPSRRRPSGPGRRCRCRLDPVEPARRVELLDAAVPVTFCPTVTLTVDTMPSIGAVRVARVQGGLRGVHRGLRGGDRGLVDGDLLLRRWRPWPRPPWCRRRRLRGGLGVLRGGQRGLVVDQRRLRLGQGEVRGGQGLLHGQRVDGGQRLTGGHLLAGGDVRPRSRSRWRRTKHPAAQPVSGCRWWRSSS